MKYWCYQQKKGCDTINSTVQISCETILQICNDNLIDKLQLLQSRVARIINGGMSTFSLKIQQAQAHWVIALVTI